jgi:phosphoribosylformimino-5-aminoimidazole carboxamide ribotide isomerase
MKFRPCIDLHKGMVKQIVGASYSDDDEKSIVTNFESAKPAAWYAALYKRDGLSGGHVIMLGPGNETAAREALAAFPGGLEIGGGITPENANTYLKAGASHVIMTSYVFKDGNVNEGNLEKACNTIGKERLVLDLSCRKIDRKYHIVTDRWQKVSETVIDQSTLVHLATFCDEFLVHAVDVEGKQEGVETELIELLGRHSPIPTTYAGGIRSLEDIESIRQAGSGRVDFTVGSSLDIFGGKLSYADVIGVA